MGFNSVYKALQDVFPQVDSRILRAVAIEHSKDADVAVEVVLTEVIPHLPKQSKTVTSFNKTDNSPSYNEVVVDGGITVQLEATMDHVNVVSSPSKQSTTQAGPSRFDANGETHNAANGLEKSGDNSNVNLDNDQHVDERDLDDNHREEEEFVDIIGKKVAFLADSFEDDSAVVGYIQEQGPSQLVNISDPHFGVSQEVDNGSSSKTVSENNGFVMEENTEDESVMTSVLTRSDQICSTELLEDIIEEARNEKKVLVDTMESVVDLMREVEDKEKTADEAKEDANKDCSHIFAKVDELKQALGRAKEANDMHAGEVYAERAILATELKELQLRLFALSDERKKSLAILEEMRGALEIRLATALKEIEAAEGEKMEKEAYAREALKIQESQLEKVVEESKKLKREAEENSKLQEFLMDRGRAIDILQGEISVKCQDVLLLKEKFDKRIPLSRSLSSSQTSSVLAASPTPSFRRTTTATATLFEPESEIYETPKKSLDLDDSYDKLPISRPQSPNFPIGQQKQSDAWKLLLNDDDWELFDKADTVCA